MSSKRAPPKLTSPLKPILKQSKLNPSNNPLHISNVQNKLIRDKLERQRRHRQLIERQVEELAKKDPTQLGKTSSIILKRLKTKVLKKDKTKETVTSGELCRNTQLASLDDDRSYSHSSLIRKLNKNNTFDHFGLTDLETARDSSHQTSSRLKNNDKFIFNRKISTFGLRRRDQNAIEELSSHQSDTKEQSGVPSSIQNIISQSSKHELLAKEISKDKKNFHLETVEDVKEQNPSKPDLEKLLHELDEKSGLTQRAIFHERNKSVDLGFEYSRNQSQIMDKTKEIIANEELCIRNEDESNNANRPVENEIDELHKALFDSKNSMGWNF
ncbi:unnamed protein product [Moneuplotes crassus]|uniref:Uncharacterized protein n=1 Tax=Euplotes crassus TaxID=5936 RepID=A0AAD1U6K2_EUPCR|nr:unnamed protein product [Moneuplotes crassus]